jgi:hypothetical protein
VDVEFSGEYEDLGCFCKNFGNFEVTLLLPPLLLAVEAEDAVRLLLAISQ